MKLEIKAVSPFILVFLFLSFCWDGKEERGGLERGPFVVYFCYCWCEVTVHENYWGVCPCWSLGEL